jgi:hypothetical protein
MLGYRRGELLGMSLLQISANVCEEDLRRKFPETVEPLRFLREHECGEVQGFLFSQPAAAERVVELREGLDPVTMNDD